ncbi:MAG TPA: DUF6600 domain-containing protein [Blastocatellia bacterium]|nr:DUF6600 domain-containing protein [Blastocatellia bacterium]
MKRALPALLTLLLLFAVSHASMIAFGQAIDTATATPDDAEDEPSVPRVARLSFVQGDVSFLRAGVTEWAAAVENLPLLAGDQVYAGPGARAEVQLGRGNYIRLSESTALTITELLDTSAQFEVTEGIAIIRIERLATAFRRFEVDTPNSALVLQQDGLYRVNVRGENDSEVIVRNGAAEVSTLDGNFKVREGYRLVVDTNPGGRLEIALESSRDDWDQWSYERDTTIDGGIVAASPDYVNSYETTYDSFYGASDLSSYGTWTTDPSYGYCWRPRVASDWAPYRNGQWIWVPAAGWTWLSNEPWGWAPYHYGRWVHVSAFGWTWVPGFGSHNYVRHNRSNYRWRPALVYFFDCPTSRGHYVGWYPLAPGERWRRPDAYRRDNDHSHLQYPAVRNGSRRPDDNRAGIRPPRSLNGVTILPVDGFTRPDRSRVRPVAPDRDLHDWISKGARPGLPEITPLPVAAAPDLREGVDRKSRRISIPPREVITRPIVTRNRPVDSQVGVTPPRERRLISPRNPEMPVGAPSRKERGANRGEDRKARLPVETPREGAGKGEDNSKPAEEVRAPRPTPSGPADGDGPSAGRKRKRGDDSAERNSPEKNQGNDSNDSDGERRRKRPIFLPEPSPKEGNTSPDKPRDNEGRTRERRQPDEATRPREDSRPRSQEPERPRERREESPKHERPQPSPESKAQPREERRQEKEERKQERREERENRKKP